MKTFFSCVEKNWKIFVFFPRNLSLCHIDENIPAKKDGFFLESSRDPNRLIFRLKKSNRLLTERHRFAKKRNRAKFFSTGFLNRLTQPVNLKFCIPDFVFV